MTKIKSRTPNNVYCYLFSFIATCTTSMVSFADECMEFARTELEKTYCKVKAKGGSQSLPSLYSFRKNSESMQRLILKKPAQKAGIDLPPETHSQERAKPTTTNSPIASVVNTGAEPKAPQASYKFEQPAMVSQCNFHGSDILCGNIKYRLQDNLQNYQLDINALEKSNQLNLPVRNSREFQSASENQYLSSMYKIYIYKMMKIGLAGATMSFTKFVATYQDHAKSGTDFSKRFADMYELLKKERKTNGIKSRYTQEYPASIKDCMPLDEKIIVCDNVKNNWLFSSDNKLRYD